MSRFYPGQRVRILPAIDTPKAFHNSEAIFVCYGTELINYPSPVDDCCVRVFGKIFSGPSYELEPILDPGHQPAELSIDELLPFLKDKSYA